MWKLTNVDELRIWEACMTAVCQAGRRNIAMDNDQNKIVLLFNSLACILQLSARLLINYSPNRRFIPAEKLYVILRLRNVQVAYALKSYFEHHLANVEYSSRHRLNTSRHCD
jgi:hypothetical protein